MGSLQHQLRPQHVLAHPTSLHEEPYVEGRPLVCRHVCVQTAPNNEHVQTDMVADAGLMQLQRQRMLFKMAAGIPNADVAVKALQSRPI